MPDGLPTGTVTFLFSDVEGSTRLLQGLGAEGYASALGEHRRVLRSAFAAEGGCEVDTQGDAFFVAFPTAPGALRAAATMIEGLATGPIRVRIGVHTGTPLLTDEGYVGADVHRAARIASCGHGGQVLVSAVTAALIGAEVGLTDLGEHRLKDLTAPERIYQLGGGAFPALKSLHRTNLPVPTTAFLGREHELAEVTGHLTAGARLLTLTGPGGTGKTRLGLQCAAEVHELYPEGVFWVPLAALRDPRLVLEAVAHAVGAAGDLAEHLGARTMLLFLDNFEHVMDAATEVAGLLGACPRLQVLVTSREVLRIAGEQAYPVPALEPHEGRQLFLARARATDPGFGETPAVEELCARLDHLPLALELAAARVRLLSPEQLVARLSGRLDMLKAGRDAVPRQQTLRATIEWSHDLLDEDERTLFARLGVFAGGCTVEAAEAICGADLDVLQSLVDKSLVRLRGTDRFWMLESIRAYAVERLELSGEGARLRADHAQYFLALAELAAPHLISTSPRAWLRRLEEDHAELRGALDELQRSGDIDGTLRLAGALGEFWQARGFLLEGRRRLTAALAAAPAPSRARGRALIGVADLALGLGDVDAARRAAEESLALHDALGDRLGRANSLWELGYVAAEDGDWGVAHAYVAESVALFTELDERHLAIGASRTLAYITYESGDLDAARALHERNLEQARAAADTQMQALSLGSLSTLAVDQGRTDEALTMLRESHPLYADMGDRSALAINLCRFAKVLAATGRGEVATQLLASFSTAREQLGGTESWVDRMNDKTLARIRQQIDEDTFAEHWQLGMGRSVDHAVDELLGPPGG